METRSDPLKRRVGGVLLLATTLLAAGLGGWFFFLSPTLERPALRSFPLATDHRHEAELAGRKAHAYPLLLVRGQYLDLEVDQRGAVDVELKLFAPSGEQIRRVDSPTGRAGVEPLPMVAEAAGTYRLEVHSLEASPATRSYEIRVLAVRPATEEDQHRAAAERAFADAALAYGSRKPERAIDAWQEARSHFERLPDGGGRSAETLYWLGRTSYHLGALGDARAYYQAALPGLSQHPRRQAQVLTSLGLVQQILKQPEAARASYRQAIDLYRSLGELDGEALALSNLGKLEVTLFRSDAALAVYGHASALYLKLEDRCGHARINNLRGHLYLGRGQTDTAIGLFEAARGNSADCKPALRADILDGLSTAFGHQNRSEEGLAMLEKALILHRQTGVRRNIALTLQNLGWQALDAGQLSRAQSSLQEARRLLQESEDRRSLAVARTNLGRLELQRGNQGTAQEHFLAAHELFEQVVDHGGKADALQGLVRIERKGDPARLLESLEQMLKSIESLRLASASPRARAEYFASQQEHYDLAIDVLMELAAREPAAGHAARAWQTAERRRARGLLDTLDAARLDLSEGVEPQVLARRDAVQRRLLELEQRQLRLRETLGNGDQEARPRLREQLHSLRADLRETALDLDLLDTQMRGQSKILTALIPPEPRPLEEIRRQLTDEHTVLLAYSLGEERSFLWVLTPGDLLWYDLPPRDEIAETVQQALFLLTEAPHVAAEQRVQLLGQLGNTLLAPAADLLVGKRLLILPDGPLHYLPFAALELSTGPGQPSKALIHDHEIVLLPSASAAVMLQTQHCHRSPAPALLALFDDPVYERDDPRISSPGGAVSGDPFRRLLFSAREAQQIHALARTGEVLRATGSRAHRAAVLEGNLERYRILHFATHAVLNASYPELSSLALSFYDEEGHTLDGLLPLYDIYNLRLKADLVVLSACETALGKHLRGEGLVGLTRGFLHAGAAQVVASLWRVDDEATAELMRRFYHGLLEENLSPAAALRAAQLTFLEAGGRQSSPYYWAGFAVHGDCSTSFARE